MVQRKTKSDREDEHLLFQKGRAAQPASLFALFSIIGIAILFLTILAMFVLSLPGTHLGGRNFPWLFYVSTPVILLCSWAIQKTKRAFLTDNADALLKYQSWALAFSILFCILQVFAWQQLWQSGITLISVNASGEETVSSSGAYLYVLSGLHIVHLLGGLGFLFACMFRLVENRDDLVKAVVFFSDRREGARISALVLYWHFLGALWLVMFLTFLFYFI